MNTLLFICGSLEQGRDGVGDYTRRLALALVDYGYQVNLLALNDSFMSNSSEELQHHKSSEIKLLRLASNEPWKTRLDLARDFISRISPKKIILQFVPYSFNDKGLPFDLPRNLKFIGPGAEWYIMFHELWIGMEEGARLKQKAIGYLQRRTISKLLKSLSPLEVFTQSSLYIEQLKSLGWTANHLPLFGNIPPLDEQRATPRAIESITLVMFGGIHPGAPVGEFARELAEYSRETGRPVRLVISGRSGGEQQAWQNAFLSEGLNVEVIGEQTIEKMTSVFASGTCGIATTPMALIEKSGAAAAMLEHSLPVINVARKWTPRKVKNWMKPNGVFEYKRNNLSQILNRIDITPVEPVGVSQVARQFVEKLKN